MAKSPSRRRARRSRARPVARTCARADSRRTGHRQRPGRLEGRHAGRRRRARSSSITPDHPYVSRGGVKLAGALDAFAHRRRPAGARSTSAPRPAASPTCCSSAAPPRSIALDVGHGQLDWRLRTDPRVVVREGVNARALSKDDVPYAPDLVTIDVAFISLRHILPPLPPLLAAERGRRRAREAAVRSGTRRSRQARARHRSGRPRGGPRRASPRRPRAPGFERIAMAPAAITGATGNQEFFLHLRVR